MAKKICVMGVGNVLQGDDGLGPFVLQALEAHYEFPPEVWLFDAGTPGLDLTLFLDGIDALLVVDAVKAEGPPGTVRTWGRDALVKGAIPIVTSPHDPTLRESLMRLEMFGHCPSYIKLIGVIPEDICTRNTLTDPVRAAVPIVEEQIVRELEGLNASPARRKAQRLPDVWWESP